MIASQRATKTPAARRQRALLIAAVMGAASIDGVTKLAAKATLDDGPTHIIGPIGLKLGHNSGVAFGLGATGPAWIVLAVTAVVIAVLAAAAWQGRFASPLAAGLILGGAVANFVDRISDGAVTDIANPAARRIAAVAKAANTAADLALSPRRIRRSRGAKLGSSVRRHRSSSAIVLVTCSSSIGIPQFI